MIAEKRTQDKKNIKTKKYQTPFQFEIPSAGVASSTEIMMPA